MRLYLVTSNYGKVREVNELMKEKLSRASMDVHEIQTTDVKEVVRHKALAAYSKLRKPVVVEDTGLYIRAWNGYPGALVKFMISAVGCGGLSRLMGREKDRRAYVETAIGFYDGKTLRVFVGITNGRIARRPRGSLGFGFDPIFNPIGTRKTLAQMRVTEKNTFSARGKAFRKLSAYLHRNGLEVI